MKDFTLKKYKQLLETLINQDFKFVKFDDLVKSEMTKVKCQKINVKSVIAVSKIPNQSAAANGMTG